MKLPAVRFQVSVPVIVAGVFGACAAVAILAVGVAANAFTNEFGVGRWVFVVVPSLIGMVFALLVYQGAERRVTSIPQSLSRALLAALVTWLAVSALGTWAWCVPREYASCLSYSLLLSATIGGGPLLLAALVGGTIGGIVILGRRARIRRADDAL